MFAKIKAQDFPLLKERKEAHRQWLLDQGWSLDYQWDGHDHASCTRVPGGRWKLAGWGLYQASDWNWRVYSAHRCTGCGMMVQHSQTIDQASGVRMEIQRQIITP